VALVLVGLVGIVVPVLPGLTMVWAGAVVWAIDRQDAVGWTILAFATVVAAVGTVVKYAWPGRRLRTAEIGWRTLGTGAAFGVIGFFVVPVIGLLLGFVLGVFVAEYARAQDSAAAWASTKLALVAVGWSIVIELAAGLAIATTLLVTAVAT
jgi:hypothetical protein